MRNCVGHLICLKKTRSIKYILKGVGTERGTKQSKVKLPSSKAWKGIIVREEKVGFLSRELIYFEIIIPYQEIY